MALPQIYRGMDGTVQWPFNNKEGNPIDFTNEDEVSKVTIYVVQNYRDIKSYVLGVNPELRVLTGADDTLEWEYTTELTKSLAEGVTRLRAVIRGSDDEVIVDSQREWAKEVDVFEVI